MELFRKNVDPSGNGAKLRLRQLKKRVSGPLHRASERIVLLLQHTSRRGTCLLVNRAPRQCKRAFNATYRWFLPTIRPLRRHSSAVAFLLLERRHHRAATCFFVRHDGLEAPRESSRYSRSPFAPQKFIKEICLLTGALLDGAGEVYGGVEHFEYLIHYQRVAITVEISSTKKGSPC